MADSIMQSRRECWDWHTGAEYSVHRNHDFDLRLKRECQERFEKLYGHEKFMEVFGKSWI